MKRAEIIVKGMVQGVFFRQGVKAEAERLGLKGWVKNEDYGAVRIVAEGEEKDLQELIEWCRKGTEWAKVVDVEVNWSEVSGEFGGFEVR